MTNYTKATNFAAKDSLASGNAAKVVKGTEIDTEFTNIETAVNSKSDSANPVFTGVAEFDDGSASAPSITNTADTNTGMFFPAADTIALTTGGTERLRLDSSGNLGFGVTPNSWVSSWRALALGGSTGISGTLYCNAGGTTGQIGLAQNWFFNGSNNLYITSAAASDYYQFGGAHVWRTAASGTAGNAITFTQAMTLDSSGNLALGSTSILGSTNRASFTNATSAKGVLAIQNTSTSGYSAVELYDNAGSQQGAMGWGNGSVAVSGATSATYLYSTGAITFLSGGTTERARIDSSGNLLVGTTSTVGTANPGASFSPSTGGRTILALGSNNTGAGYELIQFYNPNGKVGRIETSGSSTAYVTSSDYRLKDNPQPMQNALATVAQLKPCTYTWKADGSEGQGFIAHELQAVVPDAVFGEKDAVDDEGNPKYQGIDTSFLVATLTAAIQELNAKFEAYKAAHP